MRTKLHWRNLHLSSTTNCIASPWGYMVRETPDHTLQATALINEAYVRLIEGKHVQWRDRAHFFALSAKLMRRILVDFGRSRQSQKRGGERPIRLEESAVGSPQRSIELV